jgi:ubiquinone biosynthesis protein
MQRTSLDRFRENLRLQQVYNTFLRYGIDMLLDRGMLGDFRRTMQTRVFSPPHPLENLTIPIKTRLMIQELGPIYVKVGQIVSSQSSFLPQEWADELAKLQSEVPPFPSDQVRQIISEELGAPPEELFATFDLNPLAAASTAQVHRATLIPSGEEVVVKVQRPHIRLQAKADLGIMHNAARVLARRSSQVSDMDLVGMLEEFSSNVLRELDYGNEFYNAYRLSQNLANIPGVHIPIVYPQFSTSRVLTMEFVRGVKLSNLVAIEQAGLDKQPLAETTLRSMVKQLLIDGFFHADPHPGNLMVNLETGMITYLDLGMVGELTLKQRLNIIDMFATMYQQDTRGLAQVLLGLCKPIRKVDEEDYFRDFERRVGRYLDITSTEVPFGDMVNLIFAILREHGLRLDAQLTLGIKAMVQAEAITRVLFPATDIVPWVNRYVQEFAIEQITADNVKKVVMKEGIGLMRDIMQRTPSLREATLKWLEQYHRGRFELYLDTSDLNRAIESTQQNVNQIIIGLLLIGMIIGSAIASSFSALTGEFGNFLTRLAFFGYAGSMIVAIVFVIVMLWRIWKGTEQKR